MNRRQAAAIRQYESLPIWEVVWAPEGRVVATVPAKTAKAAIKMAPEPYRRYPGELYAREA